MTTGFPEDALLYLHRSYLVFPVGHIPGARDVTGWGAGQVADSFGLAFRLAAPFCLLSMAYNVTLGAINRAMPQLMVAFIGAPAITWASLALLMLAAPSLLDAWLDSVGSYLSDPFAPR